MSHKLDYGIDTCDRCAARPIPQGLMVSMLLG
jgi:hypothetical protein